MLFQGLAGISDLWEACSIIHADDFAYNTPKDTIRVILVLDGLEASKVLGSAMLTNISGINLSGMHYL